MGIGLFGQVAFGVAPEGFADKTFDHVRRFGQQRLQLFRCLRREDRAGAQRPSRERRREGYQRVAAIGGEVACGHGDSAQAVEAVRLGQQWNRPGAKQ